MSIIDLPQSQLASLAGVTVPPPPAPATPFHKTGAAMGAALGARRGSRTAIAGGILGAVAGAAAQRVAQRPELRPAIELLSDGGKAVRDVFQILQGVLARQPVATAPEPSSEPGYELDAPPGPSTPRR